MEPDQAFLTALAIINSSQLIRSSLLDKERLHVLKILITPRGKNCF